MTVFSKIQIVLAVLLGPNGLRAGWWCDCGGIWRARVGTWKLELLRARWKEEPEPAVGTALPHRSVLSLPVEDFSLSGLFLTKGKEKVLRQQSFRIFGSHCKRRVC